MANIEIYTSPFCGFCYRAKSLLNDKGVDYIEVDIISQPKRHSEMLKRAGGLHTVPQIFIDNQHGITIEDCERVSKHISNLLEMHPIYNKMYYHIYRHKYIYALYK